MDSVKGPRFWEGMGMVQSVSRSNDALRIDLNRMNFPVKARQTDQKCSLTQPRHGPRQ